MYVKPETLVWEIHKQRTSQMKWQITKCLIIISQMLLKMPNEEVLFWSLVSIKHILLKQKLSCFQSLNVFNV